MTDSPARSLPTLPLLAGLMLAACGTSHSDDAGPDGAIDAARIDAAEPPAPDSGPDPRDAGPASDGGPAADSGATTPDAGAPEPCDSPGAVETVSCGMCGTLDRFCTASGTWANGACEGENGECRPGTTETGTCGNCGTGTRRCTASCTWETVGDCVGERECAPGTTSRRADGCPSGQTREVQCSDACLYEPTSMCALDECSAPGTLETVECGRCGSVQRFCSSSGVWEYGACTDEGACEPGDSRTTTCGRCGTRSEVCTTSCDWEAFGTCTGTPDCCVPATEEVDLLFLVDNSNSMSEEQASLIAELPGLVRALATGDSDGDGTPDFAPIGSLHAAVVTTDMGTGDATVPTCGGGTYGSRFGDDGVLIRRGNTSLSGCAASYPSIFTFDAASDDPDAFAADLSCVATLGTGGCGFEQQLESVLKATSPDAATAWTDPAFTPPVFFASTSGHALGLNAGFLRPDSLLAIVIVTDEEDCSALDPEVFDPTSSTYTSDLNLRCFNYPGALHPIARFVDGLAHLRLDPERLLVASIVGIPLAAEPSSSVPDYDAILDHPAMTPRIDPASPTRLVPSCDVPGRGLAFPPRRIVTMQRDLEARGVATTTGSICQESFADVTDRILARIAERLPGTCP